MPTDVPIACTLTAAEMRKRLAEIRAIGRAALVSAEATGSEAVLRFRLGADTRGRLRAVVAAESECCAFLGFDLSEEPEALVLAIRAPDGGEPVLQELIAAFGEEAAAT
jgi:hypothetical protein